MLQGLGSFVIPILSGYLFLTQWNFTKYRILKESGYHVLFRSAFIGVPLFIASNGIVLFITNGEYNDFVNYLEILVPVDNSLTLTFTFLLGLGLPIPLNVFYRPKTAMKEAAKRNGDIIQLLIKESVDVALPVHLSLRSGKNYIGFVVESQFIWQNDPDIALVPIASGYRDKDTQKLVITSDYSPIIEEISFEVAERDINDFRIVIPMSEVISVRYFDDEIYNRLQKEESIYDS